MAWSAIDFIFKTFVGRRATSTNKKYYEEFSEATLDIYAEDVKNSSPNLNNPAQAIIDGLAQQYTLFALTEDTTVPNHQCYYAKTGVTRLGNWISDRFGANYRIRLFDNTNAEIFPTNTLDWIFNYKTGILTMNGNATGFSRPFKVSGYRYIGGTGGGASSTSAYPKTVFVRTNGNDATGEVGNSAKPYLSIDTAIQVCPTGGIVKVGVGLYDEYNISTKSDITVEFESGAIIQPTFNSGDAAIFTDLINATPVTNFKIRGRGILISLGSVSTNTCAINATVTGSTYDIEADLITGVNANNGVTVEFRNTAFHRQFFSILNSSIIAKNCVFDNIQDIGSAIYPGKYVFKDCKFIRSSITNQYSEAVPIWLISVRSQDVFVSTNQQLEFNRCVFKNLLITAGANIFNVYDGNYNPSTSRLVILDCDFEGNSSNNAIKYTDVGALGVANGELEFYLDRNRTNMGIFVEDTGGPATVLNNSIIGSTGFIITPLFVE